MRDIKFRVWDDNYKYMNYKVLVGMWGKDVLDEENYTACSMYIYPENVDYKCEPHWGHFEPYHKDIKLMQYTGLKDINGKEIYEGDIVEADYIKTEVIFENGSFKLKGYNNKNIEIASLCNLDVNEYYLKVIGNIYENKELLD